MEMVEVPAVTFETENFHRLFVNRDDTYAIQLPSGSYSRVEATLTNEVLEKHLKGEVTVGAYQLDNNNTVKWFCFDLDPEHLDDPKAPAQKLLDVCFERIWKHSVLLEASRYPDPSYHLWIFFSAPFPAKAARWLGYRIIELASLNPRQIEVFPKQDELTKEFPYGNLVKLPLGFHRKAKKWSRFLDFETFQPTEVDLSEVWGTSFSEADTEGILAFKEKVVQARFELPKSFKPLRSREEERTARMLAKYWVTGYRNDLEISFLGLCIKKGVSRESAYRIIEQVCRITATSKGDTEKALRKVEYHYEKRRSLGQQLKAKKGIKDVMVELKSRGLVK